MMVSAVDIDGLNKLEQMEHLFNDVKYATLSLDKDIKQITEKFSEDILRQDREYISDAIVIPFIMAFCGMFFHQIKMYFWHLNLSYKM